MSTGWIGVDLDGTLAEFHGWDGSIGAPIPLMVERVKLWRSQGIEVRIFTARVGLCSSYSTVSNSTGDVAFVTDQEFKIKEWCLQNLGEVLPVTATKDWEMLELWDDRAHRVEPNTGMEL